MLGYVNVISGNITVLKAAIYNAHTLYLLALTPHTQPSPSIPVQKRGELDRAVLAFGYGVLPGDLYWLIRNSWSTCWGNDDYLHMSKKAGFGKHDNIYLPPRLLWFLLGNSRC